MALNDDTNRIHIPKNIGYGEFILNRMRQYGDRIAMIDETPIPRQISYNDLYKSVNNISSWLTNTYDREIEYQLRDSQASVICVCNQVEDVVKQAVKRCSPLVKSIIAMDDNIAHEASFPNQSVYSLQSIERNIHVTDLSLKHQQQQQHIHDSVAFMPYSSGTTGQSKGVMLTNYNLIGNLILTTWSFHKHLFAKLNPSSASTKQEYDIHFLPLYHMFGFLMILYSAYKGATVVFMQRFDIQYYCMMPRYLVVVPPVFLKLIKHPDAYKYDLSSVQALVSAAAPLKQETIDEMKRKHPHIQIIVQAYGMTELTAFISAASDGPPGNVGQLLPHTQCKVVDIGKGTELGPGCVGELCLKTPCIMKGYLNKKSATATTIDEQGWLHTGDIGYCDSNQYIFVVDRLKEMIKVKAHQVPPAELEAILLTHEYVADAGVFATIIDGEELPTAWVVLHKDVDQIGVRQAIEKYVNDQVAPYKRLTGGIHFVDIIPKSPTGKILRRKMKAEHMKAKL